MPWKYGDNRCTDLDAFGSQRRANANGCWVYPNTAERHPGRIYAKLLRMNERIDGRARFALGNLNADSQVLHVDPVQEAALATIVLKPGTRHAFVKPRQVSWSKDMDTRNSIDVLLAVPVAPGTRPA